MRSRLISASPARASARPLPELPITGNKLAGSPPRVWSHRSGKNLKVSTTSPKCVATLGPIARSRRAARIHLPPAKSHRRTSPAGPSTSCPATFCMSTTRRCRCWCRAPARPGPGGYGPTFQSMAKVSPVSMRRPERHTYAVRNGTRGEFRWRRALLLRASARKGLAGFKADLRACRYTSRKSAAFTIFGISSSIAQHWGVW